MIKPLISVIIPLFNAEEYISECIFSVLNQTYPNFEIIVVNNNSTDSSVEIVTKLVNQNINLMKLVNEPTPGASFARNTGFSISKGEYIQFLDADDFIDKDKLESQLSMFDGDTDMVVSDYSNYSNDFSIKHRTNVFTSIEENFLESAILKIISSGNPLYKREIIEKVGGYNQDLSSAQDWDFNLRIILENPNLKYLKGDYYKVRKVENSLSSNWINVYFNTCLVIENLKKKIQSNRLFNERICNHISSIYYLLLIYHKKNNKAKDKLINEFTYWNSLYPFDFSGNRFKKSIKTVFGLNMLIVVERILIKIKS